MIDPIIIRNWALVACLIMVSLEDMKDLRISNRLILLGITDWLTGAVICNMPAIAILKRTAAVFFLCSLLFFLVKALAQLRYQKVFGGGDLKLIFVSILYLGIEKGLYMLLAACGIGAAFAAYKRKKVREAIPFGPCIAMGTLMFLELW